jgi:hypothetical protein
MEAVSVQSPNQLTQSLLASFLADIAENEGVLVCNDTLPPWDEFAVSRAFSTFQFSPFAAGDGDGSGLNFHHIDSGTTLCYHGAGLTVGVGGHIVEAMDDLLRVLSELGWKNVVVYSINGEAFYSDLIRHMPATVDIQLELKDIPDDVEMSGLSELSRHANQAQQQMQNATAPVSLNDEFMSVFRQTEGIQSSPSIASDNSVSLDTPTEENALISGSSSPRQTPPRTITLNSPSPVAVSIPVSPANPQEYPHDDLDLVIPKLVEEDISPLSQPAGRTSETISPSPAMGISVAVVPTVSPPPIPTPSVPVRDAVVAPSPASETVQNTVSDPVAVSPAAPTKISSTMEQETLVHPSPATVITQTDVYRFGAGIVVIDAPWSRVTAADIESLSMEGGVKKPRKIVFFEPGSLDRSERHVSWNPFDEIPDGRRGVEIARSLVAALWPDYKAAHLFLAALLSMVKEEGRKDDRSVGISDFLQAADAGVEANIRRLQNLGAVDPFYFKFASIIQKHIFSSSEPLGARMQTVDRILEQIVPDLWPSLLYEAADSGLEGNDAYPRNSTISFLALAKGDDSRVVVISLDSLDQGSVAEFLVKGLARWVACLAQSERVKSRSVPGPAEIEEEKPPVEKMISAEEMELLSTVLLRLKGHLPAA